MTPTEDDGSKRRGLAPVTRKKRLPEALSWRLCPLAPPCPSRVHLGTQGDPAAQIPEEDDPGHEEEDGGAGDCSPGRAPRGWNSSFMPKPCSSQGSFVSTG
jgi:hypothetical protein